MNYKKIGIILAGAAGALLLSGCSPKAGFIAMAKTHSTVTTDEGNLYLNQPCKITVLDKESGKVKWQYDKKVTSEVCQNEK
ncbi:MAG: hypothetical protein B5M52_08115 [Helicobacteraceae bacterium 4484_230]|nr:MAG: hypothetical protein B5M52_08115 [Helicobacteraceae bacterium 4484_230]